jgi:hypothetical protein
MNAREAWKSWCAKTEPDARASNLDRPIETTHAPFVKGERVTIGDHGGGPPFDNSTAIVRSIRWKPYPSGKKTPGWWVVLDLDPVPPGLKKARIEIHASHVA